MRSDIRVIDSTSGAAASSSMLASRDQVLALLDALSELQTQLTLVEEGYQLKSGVRRSGETYFIKLQEELGEFARAYLDGTPATVTTLCSSAISHERARQAADVLAFLLILCARYDINVAEGFVDKWLPIGTTPELFSMS